MCKWCLSCDELLRKCEHFLCPTAGGGRVDLAMPQSWYPPVKPPKTPGQVAFKAKLEASRPAAGPPPHPEY
jgi:hypothetical protein